MSAGERVHVFHAEGSHCTEIALSRSNARTRTPDHARIPEDLESLESAKEHALSSSGKMDAQCTHKRGQLRPENTLTVSPKAPTRQSAGINHSKNGGAAEAANIASNGTRLEPSEATMLACAVSMTIGATTHLEIAATLPATTHRTNRRIKPMLLVLPHRVHHNGLCIHTT